MYVPNIASLINLKMFFDRKLRVLNLSSVMPRNQHQRPVTKLWVDLTFLECDRKDCHPIPLQAFYKISHSFTNLLMLTLNPCFYPFLCIDCTNNTSALSKSSLTKAYHVVRRKVLNTHHSVTPERF